MVKPSRSIHHKEAYPHTAHWLQQLESQHGHAIIVQLQNACALTEIVGEGHSTFVGLSCLKLGMEMANILAHLNMDADAIAAALLYPFVQHDQLSLDTIAEEMGNHVLKLIQGVAQMEAVHSLHQYLGSNQYGIHHSKIDNLRRMLLAIVEDVRVVMITLAERLVVLHHMDKLTVSTQQRIAQETMDIYAPLANRLGIGQLKWELEDLAFRYLDPVAYKDIAAHLDESRIDREHYIARVITILKEAIHESGITAVEVYGRAKHIYSICKKMRRKNVNYEQIYDVSAVRILVPSIADCYSTLGIIHSRWPHISSEFDDYIANPKPNGYRSIHTAIQGLEQRNIEVQIRTFDMHEESELGVAAHWVYKEGAPSPKKGYEAKIALLRQVLDWQQNIAMQNQEEALSIDTKALEDRVYVFTPSGEVVDLPRGATVLDFAYYIHSELGHHCRGAKINRRIVPLHHTLTTGEQVEILTAKHSTPSRDWLNQSLGFIKTSRARAKVHHWFKRLDYDQRLAEGQTMLERELRRLHMTSVNYTDLAHKLKLQTAEEMLLALADHDIKLPQILALLPTPISKAKSATAAIEETQLLVKQPAQKKFSHPIIVSGIGNIVTHVAGCCKPIPGDPILGFVSKERGISVHHQTCINIQATQEHAPERIVHVSWAPTADQQQRYPVDLHISADDRPGLIRDISTIIANEKLNVTAMTTKANKIRNSHWIILTLEVPHIDVLEKIILKIRQAIGVHEVYRKID